ncbi:oxidoreductase [Citrobacter sp. NCU1]|uniref:type IV pilus biogenesis protein PilM n=1 Tax=Citrobacter sp. NCU1 TaxID=2026683 RepID=UPI001391BB1B|nr:type IV pilus biogenesis protein PilM [Citrobacter sp. NCU1]NDO82795.1 oxidoreductase [Citrobacter sp. NCU1]
MKSLLVVALCILVITVYQNSINTTSSYNDLLRLNKASLFLNYTSAFDDYYLSNASAVGDVTSKVVVPVWLPKEASIKMYVNNGYGYVYMPTASGVFSEIMKSTDNSALVGISDNSVIKTNSGTITKPAFIPSGYIVYMR